MGAYMGAVTRSDLVVMLGSCAQLLSHCRAVLRGFLNLNCEMKTWITPRTMQSCSVSYNITRRAASVNVTIWQRTQDDRPKSRLGFGKEVGYKKSK